MGSLRVASATTPSPGVRTGNEFAFRIHVSTTKLGQRYESARSTGLRIDVLGSLLRAARYAARLRQVDLAECLGLSQTVISNVERGARPLSVMELRDWLRALGVDFVQFADRLDRSLTDGATRPVAVARPVAKRRRKL